MHSYKFDLGISRLKSEWKEIFSTRYLREDFFAGATVACIAIPLSLAIGLASDVEPGQALVTAIIAGIVCALFGGSPLSVSGPAAAMAVIVASNVEKFGMGGLLVIGLLCGVFQLISGVLGLGRFARFVPVPVISGFTAGIGAIILIGQLPRVLGLAPPDQAHVFDVLSHITTYLGETQWAAVFIAGLTLAINLGLPKIFPKLPAPLCAVGISTLICQLFSLKIGVIGEIPRSLPLPKFPALPTEGWGVLVASAFIVFLIASLETLLSCSAVDKLSGGQKHDPDQELVGQGLGNLISSLFGGIPVTAVIARSALNYRAGAKTRRSSLIHSVFLLLSVLIFAPALQVIPVAALAGVLISIALVMLHPGEFKQLWKASRSESIIYLVTFLTIVFVDLLAGVQAGVVAMLGLILIRTAQTRVLVHEEESFGPARLSLSGPLIFLAFTKIEKMREKIHAQKPARGVVIDASKLTALDTSGATTLIEFITELQKKGIRVAIQAFPKNLQKTLLGCDDEGILPDRLVITESEVNRVLSDEGTPNAISKLLFGIGRFQQELKHRYEPLLDKLSTGQDPHTLFITCSDSRINPNLVTSTDPGELFIVRNAGNIVPPYQTDHFSTQAASLEFAVGVLKTRSIVICGHSACGAVSASMNPSLYAAFPNIIQLSKMIPLPSNPAQKLTLDEAIKFNVKNQVKNLLTYPWLRELVEAKMLKIYGWYYYVDSAKFLGWDEDTDQFLPLNDKSLFGRTLAAPIKQQIHLQTQN